jgi:2-polyprenyl-3-methyl-5-hydroxy-6-metoxy-1,4-benzoquinol methylase
MSSAFSDRAKTPFTTSWGEHFFAKAALDHALNLASVSPECTVADIGCGDGRFVRELLDRDFQQIVAIDSEIEPLVRLQKSLTDEEKLRVLVINSSILDLTNWNFGFEFVIAWSLFTHLPEFDQGLNSCHALLKENGFLLSAEPTLEHHLIYSLIRNDIAEFCLALETNSRPYDWSDKTKRYLIHYSNKLDELMQDRRFEIKTLLGVPIWPALVFGTGTANTDNSTTEELGNLWEKMSKIDSPWNRQRVYLSQKKSNQVI